MPEINGISQAYIGLLPYNEFLKIVSDDEQNLLNVFEDNLQDPDRDYLFLSKGHDVPALYGTLVEMGILAEERLQNNKL